jgi:hypothetical protein
LAEIVVGLGTLSRRLDAISGPAIGTAMMVRIQARTLTAMKHHIARKTSQTSRALHPGPVSPTQATILGSQNALWLDRGTKPHIIRPKSKKALRWAATAAGRRLSGRPRKAAQRGGLGGLAFAKVVHHPGTRAQPFIDASIKEAFQKSGLTDVIVERWDKAA